MQVALILEKGVVVDGPFALDENATRPARILCPILTLLGESPKHQSCLHARVARDVDISVEDLFHLGVRVDQRLVGVVIEVEQFHLSEGVTEYVSKLKMTGDASIESIV